MQIQIDEQPNRPRRLPVGQLIRILPVKKTLLHYMTYLSVQRYLRSFRPKIRFEFTRGNFTIKTAENRFELEQVLRLRHEVFHKEFLGRTLPLGLDTDRYDRFGDHLIIVDRVLGEVVGTYRLICSKFSKVFYSTSEFELDSVLGAEGIKLELSRACIGRNYRTGAVITLLWRGLVRYIQNVDASYLFGCASIRSVDTAEVATIYRYLEANVFLSDSYRATPLSSYTMHGLAAQIAATPWSLTDGKELIAPLLASYLRAGAKVCGLPALDLDFQCVDFLTVLKMSELTTGFDRKYKPTEKPPTKKLPTEKPTDT